MFVGGETYARPMTQRGKRLSAVAAVGAAFIIFGAIAWPTASSAAAQASSVLAYTNALEGSLLSSSSSPALDAANAWMWAGIVCVVLGVVTLLGVALVGASGGGKPTVEAES